MSHSKKKDYLNRIVMCFIGIAICGISTGLFKTAALGLDPFQTFVSGINFFIPVSFGMLYMIACFLILIITFFFGRHYIGIGTVVNMFLLGYATDFFQYLFTNYIPHDGMIQRVIMLVTAVILKALGIAFYIPAYLGTSAYDSVSLMVTYEGKIGVYKYNRMISDIAVTGIGVVCIVLFNGGGIETVLQFAGLGTIISMFFMGPLISFFRERITNRIRNLTAV